MEGNKCLNCGSEIQHRYCGHCGQSADTHRFSMQHVFSHDLMHGVFHVDKGFLYTAKEILLRPGMAIRGYIEGRRVMHYNYFAFILLLVAVNHIVVSSALVNATYLYQGVENIAVLSKLQHYMLEYQKIIILASIPLYAISTSLLFRKAKLNFAEHIVVNAYLQGGVLLISTFVSFVLGILFYVVKNAAAISIVSMGLSFLTVVYTARFYFQFFYPWYSNKLKLLFLAMQVLSFPVLVIALIIVGGLRMAGKL